MGGHWGGVSCSQGAEGEGNRGVAQSSPIFPAFFQMRCKYIHYSVIPLMKTDKHFCRSEKYFSLNFNMEAQAQGTQCGDWPGNRGLDRRTHLPGAGGIRTNLAGPWARSVAHRPLPGESRDLSKPGPEPWEGPAQEQEQRILSPPRAPHMLRLRTRRPGPSGRAEEGVLCSRARWVLGAALGGVLLGWLRAGWGALCTALGETVVSRGLCGSGTQGLVGAPAPPYRLLPREAFHCVGPQDCARIKGRFRSRDRGIKAAGYVFQQPGIILGALAIYRLPGRTD